MNKFMTVVTNKWFRMAVSLLGIAYSIVLACFDYNVFFYDIICCCSSRCYCLTGATGRCFCLPQW